jgi:hypothetical protein
MIARFSLAYWGWRKLFVVYFLSCFPTPSLSCRLLTLLIALAGAFPDSNETAAVVLKEYRAEQEIAPSSDPKAELSSGELVTLAKGRLHSVAKLGKGLHEAIVFVFETLWPGRAVPGEIQELL